MPLDGPGEPGSAGCSLLHQYLQRITENYAALPARDGLFRAVMKVDTINGRKNAPPVEIV